LSPGNPIIAPVVYIVQAAGDVAGSLHELDAKPLREMERNMAVHEPQAWIVRFEGQHEIPLDGQCRRVAARGVVHLEDGDVAVPGLVGLLSENVKVVAVEMDGVRDRGEVRRILLDHPVLKLVRLPDAVRVFGLGEVAAVEGDLLDRGAAKIDMHGRVADEPLDKVCTIDNCVAELDFHLLGRCLGHLRPHPGYKVFHIVAAC
jgi:hypothetical protein